MFAGHGFTGAVSRSKRQGAELRRFCHELRRYAGELRRLVSSASEAMTDP
jgi:hypothetical protein